MILVKVSSIRIRYPVNKIQGQEWRGLPSPPPQLKTPINEEKMKVQPIVDKNKLPPKIVKSNDQQN